MTKTYADLRLCPNLSDSKQTSRLINKASKLGYRLIAIAFPPSFPETEFERLQSECEETGVSLVSRLDLKARASEELVRNLRRFRRRYDLVAVICESKNVARQAAKDRRVDLLSFPSLDSRRRFFDRGEAELASESLAALEIDMRPLLVLEGVPRIRFLANLRKEVGIARQFRVPIVISSGVSDEILLRRPMDLAALASLFDLNPAAAVEAVSRTPVAIVKRNQEKLSPRFVAPGIRIIRGGKDC